MQVSRRSALFQKHKFKKQKAKPFQSFHSSVEGLFITLLEVKKLMNNYYTIKQFEDIPLVNILIQIAAHRK